MKQLILFGILIIIIHTSENVRAQWVQTDGPFATNVRCLTTSRANLFAGVSSAGVYLSTNNGESWIIAKNGLPGTAVYALTSIDTIIFAGTDGSGVYRSTDSGTSWRRVNNGLKNPYISGFCVRDTTLFVLSQGGGVFRSFDYGDTWIKSDSGLTHAYSILPKDTFLFAGTDIGVFLSSNGGVNWTQPQNNGLVKGFVTTLAFQDGYLFAGTYNGIFRSGDDGINWTQVNTGLFDTEIHTLFSVFSILYAVARNNVFRSTNNGTTWTVVNDGLPYPNVSAFASIDSNLFAGTGRGVFRLTTNGGNWTEVNHGLPYARIYTFAASATNFYISCYGGIFRLTGNDKWEPILQVYDDLTTLAIQNNIFIAGGLFGSLYLSIDTARSWVYTTNFSNANIQSVAISGTNLFVATDLGMIFRSTNTGVSWDSVFAFPSYPNSINSFQTLAVKGSNLFAGTGTVGAYRSTDQGVSWNAINNGLTSTRVFAFNVSGSNLFAGTGDGVALSSNDGDSWTRINDGLKDTAVTSIAISGENLFGATGEIFHSTLTGKNWNQVSDGKVFSVVLAINNSNLFAGTYNTGIWHRPISDFSSVKSADVTESKGLVFHPNYPNPFSSQTTISFSTSKREFIDVKIFDLIGKECAHLFSGELESGEHSFVWMASHLFSGIYTCIIRAADGTTVEQPIIVH